MTTKHEYVDRPMIYVAGPYTNPDPVENTNKAIRLATTLVEQYGVTPVIPHLTFGWHLVTPMPIDFWYEYDLAQMSRCDAVFRMDGASSGADNEVRYAAEIGLPVFYRLESVRDWVQLQQL